MFVGICVLGFKFNSISRGLFGVSGSDKLLTIFSTPRKLPWLGGGQCDASWAPHLFLLS